MTAAVLHATLLDLTPAFQATRRLALSVLLLFLCAGACAESWTPPTQCDRPLPQRLYDAAVAAPGAARDDGMLYGVQRWRGATGSSHLGLKFPGQLSCAYTVSAIFKGACHPIGELASVAKVDAALAKWPKIANARELKPGDVVFWRPVRGTVLGFQVPGALACRYIPRG